MQAGNIQVIEAESNFKKVHKSIINNQNIDCLTLGVYVKIITFGQTWQLNVNGLSKYLSLSDSKIRNSIKLLEAEGYITRHPIKVEGGKFLGWSYKVYSTPCEERTKAGSPTCQKTDTPLNGQGGFPTRRFSDKTENGVDNNNRLNELLDLNKEETKEKKDTIVSKEKKFNFLNSLIELGVSSQVANDWMIVRKQKKAANTQTAFKAIEREILNTSATPDDCIRLSVERNWVGFKAEWYKNVQPSMFDDNYINGRISEMQKQIDEKLANSSETVVNGKVYR